MSCLLDCDGVEGGGKRSLWHCSGCEMPKIIEVEGGVMGKVGGEGVNWGKQHKSVEGVETKFSRLA